MGLIPDNVIDEVLTRADIESVVGRYVLLKRQGGNLWGLCPFHSEKTPSFSVNPSKGIYKCFGCGKGGGAAKAQGDGQQQGNDLFHDKVSFLCKH